MTQQRTDALHDVNSVIDMNMAALSAMVHELEGFDHLVENPIWGELQDKLLTLSSVFDTAKAVVDAALPEAKVVTPNELVAEILRQLAPEIQEVMVSGEPSVVSVDVKVHPTLH